VAEREEFLNAQIRLAWQDRGAFPGAGVALEALGMRLGSVFLMELRKACDQVRIGPVAGN